MTSQKPRHLGRKPKHEHSRSFTDTDIHSEALAYLHGRVSKEIEAIALASGVLRGDLALGLGELLLAQAGGESVGIVDQVPGVRRRAKGRPAVAAVEVADGAHGDGPRVNSKPRKTGWSDDPAERSKEMLRRRKMWGKPKAKRRVGRPKKRRISAAGMEAIREAQRQRWARQKGAA